MSEFVPIVLEREQVVYLVSVLMAVTQASINMPAHVGMKAIEIASELNTALMQHDIAQEKTA